ncbi:MAG: ATP-binding cassette domain-containing protein [Caldilineales bacterium]
MVDNNSRSENLTLGMEDTRFGFLHQDGQDQQDGRCDEQHRTIHQAKQLVSTLSVAQKQIVEIAKAVATEANVIIMDEPTAAISERDRPPVRAIIRSLRENNVTVSASHRLDEIFRLGDYVTVMRDSKHIDASPSLRCRIGPN